MVQVIDVLLLIALGIGYIVIYFARREEKMLQLSGYIIGLSIIIFATFYIFVNSLFQTRLIESRMSHYPGKMQYKSHMPPAMLPPQK